ncbi:uncharacterized protein PHALS_01729 [Plasmopara halstedii]|uniref:Uncharacterized protein n=1 Tax=Plasmopara halstedii TaxID=4781 RepID=A0A0P1AXC5_PLAHL|nr:uncharacterized protein PHALS_01729 [Plasmopara halstedii]CEG45434.1 hypothetical protein PHALS_01729 [Plasmopara halstedii]|eukprot:XP_024581803.1 hypothetical protein PHALS_01729 [Plasmopara halstedii]
MPVKTSTFLAALFLALENVYGQLSTSSLLLRFQEPLLDSVHRALAGGEEDAEKEDSICKQPGSFLGVGNTECLHKHLRTAIFLLAVIILVSIILDRVIHYCRLSIKCPQLRLIVNRIFEEMMIMGFLSMIIFSLNTSGSMNSLDLDNLTSEEQLHFYEFFHYIVFLTMIYFIIIVLLLLFIGTVVPKLIWNMKKHPNQERESVSDIHDDTYDGRYTSVGDRDDCGGRSRRSQPRDSSRYSSGSTYLDDGERTPELPSDEYYASMRARQRSDADMISRMTTTRGRSSSGMDLVMGSRAYSLLLQRYQREGWWFRFNIRKQWSLWKSFEILAYNICQNRSGYIYKNPAEMDRLFGVRPARSWTQQAFDDDEYDEDDQMTYAKYHVLCMRNLLYHMTNIHPFVFLLLIIICLLPSIFPDQDHWIFLGVGALLLLLNICIFFKVLQILRGIVDDRLRVITSREIQSRLEKARSRPRHRKRSDAAPASAQNSAPENKAPVKFKAAALAIRSIIRMQMSALCHRQLHYHDERFWFKSPKLLLRLFQVATIGQAFYLVWLSLVEINSMSDSIPSDGGGKGLLALMIVFPVLALFIITPMTMPSLVLVMSLTGIFVDLNATNGKARGKSRKVTREDLTTHTRIMRRTYLKSNYSETGYQTPVTPHLGTNRSSFAVDPVPDQRDSMTSPTNVFLRVYDSPANARQRNSYRNFALNSNSIGRENSFMSNNSGRYRNPSRSGADDGIDTSSSQTFNLAAFQLLNSPTPNIEEYPDRQSATSFCSSSGRSPRSSRAEMTIPGTPVGGIPENATFGEQVDNNADENDTEYENGQGQPNDRAVGSFKSFCSKYGGYPDM